MAVSFGLGSPFWRRKSSHLQESSLKCQSSLHVPTKAEGQGNCTSIQGTSNGFVVWGFYQSPRPIFQTKPPCLPSRALASGGQSKCRKSSSIQFLPIHILPSSFTGNPSWNVSKEAFFDTINASICGRQRLCQLCWFTFFQVVFTERKISFLQRLLLSDSHETKG